MKIKTTELSGAALDWAAAIADGATAPFISHHKYDNGATIYKSDAAWENGNPFSPVQDWSRAGPIIARENITVIRCEDEYGQDDEGFTTLERIPVWGAVCGKRHSCDTVYGPQGDNWGDQYSIDEDDIVLGPTPLIAAMRAMVAKKLGAEVDVPEELLK